MKREGSAKSLQVVVMCAVRTYTILVVEDTAVIRSMIADCFREHGDQVFEARNGCEAIAVVETQLLDAVVMDLQMPGLNGVQATTHIKADARFANLPIFAFSGGPLLSKFEPTYFVQVLSKPMLPRAVVDAVISHLEQSGRSFASI